MERSTILYYISGHGLGHASRVAEIIKTCNALYPGDRIIVRTGAPEWFFDFTFNFEYEYHYRPLDIGAIQYSFESVDIKKTLLEYEKIFQARAQIREEEAAFIKENNVSLVFSDIVPAAFDAAEEAGIPGIAHSNFSWDWIYTPYVGKYPEYAYLIDEIRYSYGKADMIMRLPLYGDLSAFKNIHDLPFVARISKKSPEDIRKLLQLPDDRIIVTLTFGGIGINLNSITLTGAYDDYYFITTYPLDPDTSHIRCISNNELKAKKIGFEDLLKVSDIVMTKPGYGTVADCIANETRMVYCDREDFQEKDVLIKGIRKYLSGIEIPGTDLFAGNWAPYLQKAFSIPFPLLNTAVDGASRAAEIIKMHIMKER